MDTLGSCPNQAFSTSSLAHNPYPCLLAHRPCSSGPNCLRALQFNLFTANCLSETSICHDFLTQLSYPHISLLTTHTLHNIIIVQFLTIPIFSFQLRSTQSKHKHIHMIWIDKYFSLQILFTCNRNLQYYDNVLPINYYITSSLCQYRGLALQVKATTGNILQD